MSPERRRPRPPMRTVATILIGVTAGFLLAVTDPVADLSPFGRSTGGIIRLTITDESGAVAPLGPPIVEISAGGGTAVFEQYATSPDQSSGLRWDTKHPVVIHYRTADPTAEPGFTATADMAAFLVARSAVASQRWVLGSRTMYVNVKTGPDTTLITIRVGDEIIAEESLPRTDRWSEWTRAAQTCASSVEEDIAPAVLRIEGLQALIESWFSRRDLTLADWAREAERGAQQAREVQGALPGADSAAAALRRGQAWIAAVDEALEILEEELRAFRSTVESGLSESEPDRRFDEAFNASLISIYDRTLTLGTPPRPTLWCAAG
jgi:hypothetical protein